MKDFLLKEFSVENYLFLKAVADLRETKDANQARSISKITAVRHLHSRSISASKTPSSFETDSETFL